MDWKKDKTGKWIVFLFFVLLLALGTRFFTDYGISWDEPTERRSGIYSFCTAYKFLTGNSLDVDLTKWCDKYYGVGVQHILLLADYLAGFFNVHPYGNLPSWLLRHFLTCMFMICGLFFMYKTMHLLWRNRLKALLPVILFLFMPRFVSESFYNIKDMGLLSGMMIGGYFMVRYALYTRWQNALYLGIATAFVCSIRLSGLQYLPAGMGIALFMDMLCGKKFDCKKTVLHIFILLFSFAFLLILLYPACWEIGPGTFFREAAAYMANHPWDNAIRFCGKEYAANMTPWYYLAVWMGITIPIPLLLLLFWGSGATLKRFITVPRSFFCKRTKILFLIFFLMFWGEFLLLPLILKSYYNGWRHFYFLGYPMLILAGCGIMSIWKLVKEHKIWRRVFYGAVILVFSLHITWMITQHPHQYLYFNILPGDPQNQFELDYWHVSRIEALHKILDKHTDKDAVKTIAFDYTHTTTLAMLGDDEQKKLLEVSRYGYYDYNIILNDNGCLNPGHEDRYPLKGMPRKVISDEILWIKNSLWTKQVMAYRIVGFEKTPGAKCKPVQY